MAGKKPKRVDVNWLRGRARGMPDPTGPNSKLLHLAADYIEYLERQLEDEQAARAWWEEKCRRWYDAASKRTKREGI